MKGKSPELLTRLKFKMRASIYYKNNVIKPLKQLEVGSKGTYCWIAVCKNAQYDKYEFKFPQGDTKLQLYKLSFNKTKIFRWPGEKDSLRVTDNTYVGIPF